jgi:hypothetical protein
MVGEPGHGSSATFWAMCTAFSARPEVSAYDACLTPPPLRQAHNTFTKCLTKRLTGA